MSIEYDAVVASILTVKESPELQKAVAEELDNAKKATKKKKEPDSEGDDGTGSNDSD